MGDFLTITFGASAGILTLVGLIALFISLNNQHNIQRCREVIWSLEFVPIKYLDNITLDAAKEVYEYIGQYRSLVNVRGKVIPSVINIAKLSILIVIVSWCWVSWIYISNTQAIEREFILIMMLVIIVVLVEYLMIIGKLNNIHEVAELPTGEQLLDVSFSNGYEKLMVMAASSRLVFTRIGRITLDVELAAPWRNYEIEVTINHVIKDEKLAIGYKKQRFSVKEIDVYEPLFASYLHRLRVGRVEEPEKGHLNIFVSFSNEFGKCTAEYWGLDVTDIHKIKEFESLRKVPVRYLDKSNSCYSQ